MTTRRAIKEVGVGAGALFTMLTACSEPAREDLSGVGEALGQAGDALDDAIRQSAHDLKPHAKEAGREVQETLEQAKENLKAGGDVVDDVTDSMAGGAFDDEAARVTCAEERYLVPRDLAREVADNPIALAAEATTEETDRGYRITGVSSTGLLSRLGVRAGDVVLAVDGIDLSPPLDQTLKDRLYGDEVVVTIDRDGKRIQKTLVIGSPAKG